MMEENLESSALEDNCDIGLGFGDDSQKAEKMNQSFLLLKKKLFRSHDLIQQYSNKIKECERLRSDLESCQRESERLKQQHLTVTAKTVKLTMENRELQEANKKLEKLVTEREAQMAGDQALLQQLNCKVEDIEDRHSERVMEIELEKSGLQAKVKDLEQDIKRISRSHENEIKKLERKIDGTSPKKVNRKQVKACPFKSKKIVGLGMIEDDYVSPDAPKSPEIRDVHEEILEDIPEDSSKLLQINPPEDDKIAQNSLEVIDKNDKTNEKAVENQADKSEKMTKKSVEIGVDGDDKIPKKIFPEIALPETDKIPKKSVKKIEVFKNVKTLKQSVREIGVNVDISISPPKPVTINKNTMTDEFYNIKNNPYPVFCEKCEQLLEESLDDAICRATRLPPNIPALPPSPIRPMRTRQSPEREETSHPVILDSLQRRVKLLEKRLKRQQKTKISQQSSCCNHSHSMAHCSHNNSLNQQSQFDMMTEFFGRMMQLPGFQGLKSRRESLKRQRRSVSVRMKTARMNEGKTKKMDLSSDIWDVASEDERGNREDKSARHQPLSFNNSARNDEFDYDRDLKDDAFHSMSSDRIATRRRETLKKIIDESKASSPGRSTVPTAEGYFGSEPIKALMSSTRMSNPRKKRESPASSKRIAREGDQTRTEESRAVPRERSLSPEVEEYYVASMPHKRKRLESSSSSVPDETSSKKRKRGDDPPKSVNVRSNLLKNLKRLKKDKAAVKTIPSIINKIVKSSENVTPADVTGKKKRIAHVPKQSELPGSFPITEDDRLRHEETLTSMTESSREKRITRSLRKSTDDKNKKGLNEFISTGSNTPDPLTSSPQKAIAQSIESIEKPSKIINKEADLTIEEAPASPPQASPASLIVDLSVGPSEVIKIPSTYESAAVSHCSDGEFEPDPANCVRELRNRQIHMSPVKQKSSLSKEPENRPDSPAGVPLPPSSSESSVLQAPRKIEDLLDDWLAASRKRRGRPPRSLEVAKILQSKTENLIKQELKRLVETADWNDALHKSASDKIIDAKSPRTAAKAIVDFLDERFDIIEPLDMTFTPPAPPMTKSLQRIVTLLKDLDPKIPTLMDFVFQGIEHFLFRLSGSPSWNTVEELSKLFTVLARIKKDRERVRIMCCDAVYSLQKKSVIVLHAVLTCWPEVLPIFDAEKNQHLPLSIVHMIRAQSIANNSKCDQVKKLITAFFKYPQCDSSEVLGVKLLEALERNYDKSVEIGILLLAKREGVDWAYKHIIQGGLMKMIVEGKCSEVYHSLKLLGFLMRPFPALDTDGSLKNIIEQLKALVESDAASQELQEGAISALISLSRQKFDDIAVSVLNWQPTRELPELLHEQMNAFFASRGPHWSQIKIKSRKYTTGL